MTLSEYAKRAGRGTLAEVSRESGVSYPTVHKASKGIPVTIPTAKAISRATGGVVTVNELVEGQPTSDEAA